MRPGSDPCPQEALDVMKQWRDEAILLQVCVDQTQRCAQDNRKVWVKSGPLTSRVVDHMASEKVPEGSLLFGELKITDAAKGEATVRYLASHLQILSFRDLPKKPEVVIFKHSTLVTAPLKTKVQEQ